MNHSSHKPDLKTLLLLAFMWVVFLGNFALYRFFPLPWACHILIGAVAIHLAFTIWHEAVHGNVFNKSRWNHVVGILGMYPYMTPYFIQRHIHLMHHARLNRDDDPNRIYADGPFWQIFFRYLRAIPYMRRLLIRDPRSKSEKTADFLSTLSIASIYLLAWKLGHLRDLLLLWALPVVLAKIIMDWYVNYLPHTGLPPHKYKGTRIIDAAWLTPLVLGHNYHAIHHLWPQFPWHRYARLFAERRNKLRDFGVPIESGVWGFRHDAVSSAV